jgi:hypothetical protein
MELTPTPTPTPASPGTQPCCLDPKRDLEKDFTEPAAAQARYSPYAHDSRHRRQARRAAILDASRSPKQNPPAPVVIWNLIRRCNLTCKHCYSISADKDFAGELSTAEFLR